MQVAHRSLAAALALILSGCAASATDLKSGSVWVNQNNSVLTITSVDPTTGIVSGNFVTGVGCGVGKVRPMTGVYNSNAFSFTVNFQECASTTAWSGVFNPSGPKFDMLWYLALSGSPQWNSIIAGHDTFTPK